MRTVPAGLQARMALTSTYLARIIEITRRDGTIVRITDAQNDISYNGNNYESFPGFLFNSISFGDGGQFASVDITLGIINGASKVNPILADDVITGLYDGAIAELFVIDFESPSSGAMQLGSKFILGDIEYDNNHFTAKIGMRSDAISAVEYAVRLIKPNCAWRLGDSNCGVDIAGTYLDTGTIASVSSSRTFVLSLSGGTQADAYWRYGAIKFTGGNNIGITRDIRASNGDTIDLWIGFPGQVSPGDSFQIHPGCDLSTGPGGCGKFNNIVNFGGFPFVTEKGFGTQIDETVMHKRKSGK